MPIKDMDGIIFDIDGTLWDSGSQVVKAWNKAIEEQSDLDMRVDLPFLNTLFGKPMTEIARLLFPNLDDQDRDFLAGQCFEYENRLLEREPAPLYEGVRETMMELARTYPLFIASNCQLGYIECCIRGNGIDSLITDYLCFGDTGKPKSETIKILMERNQLKSPIYVGDTQGDADACREAGIPIIYASYGFGTIDEPMYTIKEFRELTEILITNLK